MVDNVVDKHILDIIRKHPSSNVEIEKVKINPKKTKAKEDTVTISTVTKKAVKPKKNKKKTVKKKKAPANKNTAEKHVKQLQKKVKEMHSEQKKRVSAIEKELKKGHFTLKKHLTEVQKDVVAGKNIYVPEPKPSLENQIIIESMGKLTAVVKQLIVLFNQKVTKEEGPLFTKLNEIVDQNEKIAQGILTVADMIKEEKTPPARIRDFNPYQEPIRPQPTQLRPQQPTYTEMQNPQVPPNFGQYQDMPQMPLPPFEEPQPIQQNTAPLPPFSPPAQEQKPQSAKRMLF